MTVGIELVSVTPTDFLGRPLLWAELISRYRGTVTAAPNFAYAVLARQLARADDGSLDLSTLRFALNGAEPIDPAAVTAFTAAGARFGLRPGVGGLRLRDGRDGAGGVVRAGRHRAAGRRDRRRRAGGAPPRRARAGDGPARRFPLLGPPLPGIEVRVVGDGGAVLGEREVGVLQLRGESVTPGYLTVAGPVATQDADGWLDTGDEGYLTDGEVVVCGRRKDVIIMGGRNIYPTDIERAASGAEGVRAGNAVAVRLEADGARHRESFLVAVESRRATEPEAVQGIAQGRDVPRGVGGGGAAGRGRGAPPGQPAEDPVGEAAPRGDPRPAGRPLLSERGVGSV